MWNVGDRVVVLVDWEGNPGQTTRVQGKHGIVVEVIDRKNYPVVVDLDDSIVGRAAFRNEELTKEK